MRTLLSVLVKQTVLSVESMFTLNIPLFWDNQLKTKFIEIICAYRKTLCATKNWIVLTAKTNNFALASNNQLMQSMFPCTTGLF